MKRNLLQNAISCASVHAQRPNADAKNGNPFQFTFDQDRNAAMKFDLESFLFALSGLAVQILKQSARMSTMQSYMIMRNLFFATLIWSPYAVCAFPAIIQLLLAAFKMLGRAGQWSVSSETLTLAVLLVISLVTQETLLYGILLFSLFAYCVAIVQDEAFVINAELAAIDIAYQKLIKLFMPSAPSEKSATSERSYPWSGVRPVPTDEPFAWNTGNPKPTMEEVD
jgi:hypothetical protein